MPMPEDRLNGKVPVVTGGSKGTGRATCIALAKAGASVVIKCAFDANSADDLVQRIGEKEVLAVQADAGTVDGVDKIVKAAMEEFGKIDILIPNGGIPPTKYLESTTEEDLRFTFRVNLQGLYLLGYKAILYMAARLYVVPLSTTAYHACNVPRDCLLLCTIKDAAKPVITVMSKDLMREYICVNAAGPSRAGTSPFPGDMSAQVMSTNASFNLHNPIGTPEERADAIMFFRSHGSR